MAANSSGASSPTTYDDLIARFLTWAHTRDDLRAVLMPGSRARIERPADEWSDLDLVLVTTDPRPYLEDDAWLEAFGHPMLTFLEQTGTGGGTERRALFAGGLDVDFVPLPVEFIQQVAAEGWPAELVSTVRRGVRVLLDKDGLAARLPLLPAEEPASPPTAEQFTTVVADFWYHALWAARKLRRGELWTAHECCDAYMKWQVLQVIEWRTRATPGPQHDTWHKGRFLELWADPRALDGMRTAFGHHDPADIRRALLATMDLFRWLARETAQALGYAYPEEADAAVTKLVREVLSAPDVTP
jgi:aminoglycoside 6-adenylyltransferase